jgi:DNA-binding MarR family transcriptional regulator/GNAT superfamily N-acetyltransferase
MAPSQLPQRQIPDGVTAVRRFNRFYTQRIGVLEEGYAKGPFSLSEARVLYEIRERDKATASEIGRDLALDAGYLSRILRGFEARGLVVRETSVRDGRQSLLSMTPRGRKALAPVEAHCCDDVAAMLTALPAPAQSQLFDAMRTIETVLAGEVPKVPYMLRPPRAGDMGWVVARHGALYAQEHGWDGRIEGLTAEIVAAFVRDYDAKRERCWIAERDGENVGSVFLVKDSEAANERAEHDVARLRLLLVEPKARGLGIGARLVEEALRFAREARYRTVVLWTHSVLGSARRIYEAAGFKLTKTWQHDEFGLTLDSESWELKL